MLQDALLQKIGQTACKPSGRYRQGKFGHDMPWLHHRHLFFPLIHGSVQPRRGTKALEDHSTHYAMQIKRSLAESGHEGAPSRIVEKFAPRSTNSNILCGPPANHGMCTSSAVYALERRHRIRDLVPHNLYTKNPFINAPPLPTKPFNPISKTPTFLCSSYFIAGVCDLFGWHEFLFD